MRSSSAVPFREQKTHSGTDGQPCASASRRRMARRSKSAAAKLVEPYKALVELMEPHLSETQLRTLSIPIAIELREFSSAACGRDLRDREGLKR